MSIPKDLITLFGKNATEKYIEDLLKSNEPKYNISDLLKKTSELYEPKYTIRTSVIKKLVNKKFNLSLILNLPEDSIYRKLLTCIPVIGIISGILNERSLASKITKTKSSEDLSKLITIKNHFKFASILRENLSIALIISGIAYPILGVVLGAACIGSMTFQAYALIKNVQLISTSKASQKIKPGTVAY